ncbi:MAG: hypothetical protein J6X87_00690 [Clostridia bacterium]|nr:hypothetical protein [Clostridia bacterium]
MKKSIYSRIKNAAGEDGVLPESFNILLPYEEPEGGETGVTEEPKTPKKRKKTRKAAAVSDGDPMPRQGEFDAVMVRIPGRMKHNVFVNFYIAARLKSAIEAYYDLRVEGSSYKTSKVERIERKINNVIRLIDRYEPVSVIDPVLSQLVALKTERDKAAVFGEYLATEGVTVQQVKTGIALLGTFGDETVTELLAELGMSEELAFFAVKALRTILKDDCDFVKAAWKLASGLRGWGKVAAILEMPDKIDDEEVRRWILAHGAQNELGLYISACECAIKGDLKGYMTSLDDTNELVDKELGDGICDIFDGLFQAESVKNADSFSEVPDIYLAIASFKAAEDRGCFALCREAPRIVEKLKARKI